MYKHLYQFTGFFPLIVSALSLGPDAAIERGGDPASSDGESVGLLGSTVVLQPGDVLHTAEPIEHPQLLDLAEPTTADKPLTKAEKAKAAKATALEADPAAPASDAPTEPKD